MNIWRRLPLAGKIVLPYLLLTLLVGVGGTFLAARLVAGSANERLTGALVEAARRADAELTAREEGRLRALEVLASRPGLVEAVAGRRADQVTAALDQPSGVDWVAALGADGRRIAPAGAAPRGRALDLALRGEADALGERQGGLVDLDDGAGLAAVTPLREGGRVVGALAVGHRLAETAAALKRASLADVVLYTAEGRVLASTLAGGDLPLPARNADGTTSVDQVEADGRVFRVIGAPLRVRGAAVGTMAMALPADTVERLGGQTRDQLALLFAAAMVAAVAVGMVVAGWIARPIRTLARTARALGAGDLDRRTGLSGSDEIGALGATFDAMADGLVQREAELRESYAKAMRALALAVDAKDPYTHGHSQRVSTYAVLLARGLGLDDATIAEIEMGGLLHDVGKIGVPDAVLTKPGKLDDDEWAAIKKHPEAGAEILRPIGFSPTVMDVVLYHHERLNGRGFPRGLIGDTIPLAARIAAVCDAFDAMTSDRSYRRSLGQAGALAELHKGAGEQFDAACVDAFVAALLSAPLQVEEPPEAALAS